MQGRKLIDGTKGSTRFSYGYNSDGLRTSKTVGNQTYTYYWNGTQLAAMTVKTNGSLTVTMQFFYNAEGTPLYFTYNGTEYFYVTNLQGDVTGIANGNGIVGYYEYDAWGKILSYSGIGSTDYSAITYNPLRYRGYIYDTETGFYYLQSRYYDPAIRRFINADGYVSTGQGFIGYNMFAYCGNNPVMYKDEAGEFFAIIGITIGVKGLLGLLGLTTCAAVATYISMPTIRSEVNSIVASSTNWIEQAKDTFTVSTAEALILGYSKAKAIEEGISKKLNLVQNIPNYRKDHEWHHIVAKAAPNAKYAYAILVKVGIKPKTDSKNLVLIKTGLHRRLHTDLYYGWANSIIIRAYNLANGDYMQQQDNVKKALKLLKDLLEKMSEHARF